MIEITTPDGKTIELNAPDGATPAQIHQAATAAASHYQQTATAQPKQSMYQKLSSPQDVSPQIQQMADTLNVPGRAGRAAGVAIGKGAEATGLSPLSVLPSAPPNPAEILKMLSAASKPKQTMQNVGAAIKSGINAFRAGYSPPQGEEVYSNIGQTGGDIAGMAAMGGASAGLPMLGRIAADTAIAGGITALSQARGGKVKVLPSGVGLPDSIVGNALIPIAANTIPAVVKPMVRGIGNQMESLAGARTGSYERAYNDPTRIGAAGKKAAQALYKEGNAIGGGIRKELKAIPDNKDFVAAVSKLVDEGKATPAETLEARKALDKVKNRVSGPYFMETKAKLDEVAKKVYANADAAFRKAIDAESLRNIFPQNKYGGASAFKTMMAGILSNADSPEAGIGRKLLAMSMSPIVGGTAATAAGIAGRALSPIVRNPLAAVAINKAVQAQKEIPPSPVSEPKVTRPIEEKKAKVPAQNNSDEKAEPKQLTKEKAYEFLKRAKNNKRNARRLAKKEGYTWDGDF